ncbi:Uncharacterised protein [Vibrio cholerae]|nr:Uncharacterised protein [Vibrio cholerae]
MILLPAAAPAFSSALAAMKVCATPDGQQVTATISYSPSPAAGAA